MTDPQHILQRSHSILLVDWPHPCVPAALVAAGFTVYGYSPGRYSVANVVPVTPGDVDAKSVFPLIDRDEKGFLVFRQLAGKPEKVDIVCVYRPVQELAGIVANQVVPMGAKVVWLFKQLTVAEAPIAHEIAKRHGLIVMDGVDIVEAAGAAGHQPTNRE